jgi:putative ABC transport system permease protein
MGPRNRKMPKFGTWLLRRFLNWEVKYSALGDFEEIFFDITQERGVFRARLWFWIQILKSIPSFISESVYWNIILLENSFKTAIRNLKRQKAYSFINIAGLSVGLACCILIVLYIHFELSFDRYHQNTDHIYRIIEIEYKDGKQEFSASTPAPLGPALAREFPEISRSVRFFHPSWIEKWKISHKNRTFFEENVFFADPDVLEVFAFPLIQGSSKDALKEPHSMIMTEKTAEKYFGSADPLGEVVAVNNVEIKVTGIAQDVPPNSHIRFDFLISYQTLESPGFRNIVYDMLNNWRSHNFYNYFLLHEESSPSELEKKFIPFLEKRFGKISNINFCLQPLRDIRLHSRNYGYDITSDKSDISYIYIFSAIALFVLIIACINYMNLTTARSSNRAKEVGMRKIIGATRLQLVKQFLGESVVLLFIAFIIAFALVSLVLPAFNSLVGSGFVIDFQNLLYILGLVFIAALMLGVFAGIYPSLFLSTFHPSNILKGTVFLGLKKANFRRILVVVQFAISVVLIIGTLVIADQLNYCMSKELGFDREQVVVIPVRDYKTVNDFEVIKNRLLQNPEILSVARSSSLPGKTIGTGGFLPEGNTWYPRYSMFVDYDFIPTMGMEIIEGRNFSRDFSADLEDAYIVNETAVKEFGWEQAVGKRLIWRGDRNRKGTVIGVLKDFHFKSLHQKIEPIIFHMLKGGFSYMTIRTSAENVLGTVDAIKKNCEEFNPNIPFEFFFLDENMNRLYHLENRMEKVSGIFTFLAVFIACLGLFGLASFVAEQRTKEIGIRKALGATSFSIVRLLSKEFLRLVTFSNIMAWPVAYYAMNKWLQNFAYRVNPNFRTFLAAGVLSLFIALLSIGYQSIKSAYANPANALRYE